MITEKVNFKNNKNQNLSGRIYMNSPMSHNGVIFCHGLFSTKDGYKITKMAESIVNAGFTLLTFDFSFVGESEGNISELSIVQEVEDLRRAFLNFQDYGMKDIHLIGSSMGGLVSLLFSSAMCEGIKTQSLIATPVLLEEMATTIAKIKDIDSLPDAGQTVLDGIPINNYFFKEIKKLNMERAVYEIKAPTLIIHGGKDVVVSPVNAVILSKILNCDKRLVLIEDGDHNLTRDSDIEILIENIVDWLVSGNEYEVQ